MYFTLFFIILGNFLGDIAIPDDDYIRKDAKKHQILQEEVEQYKQEVLEGLQIEEEGLTDLIRKKTKQPSPLVTPRSYNDPIDNPIIDSSLKNGQILQTGYLHTPDNVNLLKTNGKVTFFNTSESVTHNNEGDSSKISENNRDDTTEKPKKIRHRKRHVQDKKDGTTKKRRNRRRNNKRYR